MAFEIPGPGLDEFILNRVTSWGIQRLTEVQMKALAPGVAGGQSMVVSAPTSSGKTLVGELAILSALKSGARAVYLVSHKALADQKYLDFSARFGEQSPEPVASVGLSTGDRSEGDISALVPKRWIENNIRTRHQPICPAHPTFDAKRH